MKLNNNIENALFQDLTQIIEQGKKQVVSQVNSILTITYWHIGKKINDHLLKNERAEYGKEIVSPVATQLVQKFGQSYELKNLYRMMQFAEIFKEVEIVVTLSRQLSWSHFVVLSLLCT